METTPATAPTQAPPSVAVYTSRPEAFLVNSYLVETSAGIVLIDAQFLLSEAAGVRAQLRATGQPLGAIFVTHPHPDHFNGVGLLLEDQPSVPVYATQATVDGIRAVEAAKRAYWTPIHGADYPAQTMLPNHIMPSGETLTIGDVEFILEDLGEGETSNMSVVYLPASGTLFAGDLAYHRVHPWLVESHSQAWLEQLAAAQRRYREARTVYVGHGQPGTLAMLSEQATYITFFRKLVEQELRQAADSRLGTDAKTRIREAVLGQYPNQPLDMLVEPNIDGLVAELSTAGK